jgi:hypothetical protein
MATSYLIAEEVLPNHRRQGCRLIAEIQAPEGADSQALQSAAQGILKEKYGEALSFKPISENEVFSYLQSDSRAFRGWTHLDPGILHWYLART